MADVILRAVDDLRTGRVLRALRHRLGWRQVDVGRRAGVSQDLVSVAERGRIESMPLRTVRRLASAVGAEAALVIRWRAGDLDRLLDEGHAALCTAVAAVLVRGGWIVEPEVSFAVWGERGSIDLLAWHAPTRTLLVIEVKTEVTSAEELLRRLDVKARLAAQLARERFGWDAASVVTALVLPDTSTARRRTARIEPLLATRFPLRGAPARTWLLEPTSAQPRGLLLYMSPTIPGRVIHGAVNRKRLRRARDRPETVR